MPPGIYRITRPILALVGEECSHVAELIPAGDYIRVNGTDSERRVSIVWNRKKATMFVSELLLRSEFCPRKNNAAQSNTIDSDRRIEAGKTRREKTVLIVEDNPSDVVLLRRAFNTVATEINTIVLTDGSAAITFLEHIHLEVKLWAIVLDFYLPKRDGLEVLHAIRTTPEVGNVPVHLLTCGFSKQEEQAVRSMGATCHLKPVGLSDLSKFAAQVLGDALPE